MNHLSSPSLSQFQYFNEDTKLQKYSALTLSSLLIRGGSSGINIIIVNPRSSFSGGHYYQHSLSLHCSSLTAAVQLLSQLADLLSEGIQLTRHLCA